MFVRPGAGYGCRVDFDAYARMAVDLVNAPLDDLNVERFCSLVQEIAGRTDTRFLIITHHRVTMARMDRLYGVTMAEQGVSQLVSVNLQEADRLVA